MLGAQDILYYYYLDKLTEAIANSNLIDFKTLRRPIHKY